MEKYTLEELEEMMKNSEMAKKHRMGVKLMTGDGVEKDEEKGLELIREAAINGYIPAMHCMTMFCHDDFGEMETQNRREELFWYEKIKSLLSDKKFLYHAQNMIFGSYDRHFSPDKINANLEMAAALGNDQAKEYLAGFYAKKSSPEDLKKSLYWFYSIKSLSGRMKRQLKEVEEKLGIEG